MPHGRPTQVFRSFACRLPSPGFNRMFKAYTFKRRCLRVEAGHVESCRRAEERVEVLTSEDAKAPLHKHASVEGGTVDASKSQRAPAKDGVSKLEKTKSGKEKRVKLMAELSNLPGVPEKLGDSPLRLIIVGTNPSEHAWRSGHCYSNPSNWMWRILKQTGIAPAAIRGAVDDDLMVSLVGVGFLDVGTGTPGTVLSDFTSQTFQKWAPVFYSRLRNHADRAAQSCSCQCGRCGAPAFVAFAGKRQWQELLNMQRQGRAKITKTDVGPQSDRPEGWPFPESTEVWVMPSTSGAAPMSVSERVGPWQELATKLKAVSWPRTAVCSGVKCRSGGHEY